MLVIKPKARSTSILVCLGKFIAQESWIEWMLHPKQAFLGNAEVTVSTMEDLGADGPTIPVLASTLSPDLKAFVKEQAGLLHDWHTLPKADSLHAELMNLYHGGGSLSELEELIVAAEEEADDQDKAEEEEAQRPDHAAEEPRRGRSMACTAKRHPSASPAAKPGPKKAASPIKKEAAPATPATRRSTRLAKAEAETPSTAAASALRKLSM